MPPLVRPGRLRARLGLLLGMPLTVVVLAVIAWPADALTCDQGVTHGLFPAADGPSACWRPYGPKSPFNKPIPDRAPAAADSRAIVEHMLRYSYEFGYKSHRFQLGSRGTRAVYWSSSNDPLVTIHCTYHWGPGTCQGANGFVVDGIRIHIPAGAQPEQQWDGHMTIVDQANNAEYDFERASWTGPDQISVWSGSELPVSGAGATGLGGNADAGSFGLLGGIIRPEELQAGSINHALAISVPCTDGYVWPAMGPWGAPCSSIEQAGDGPHVGSLLQLSMSPAQIASSGYPRWQKAIVTAMSRYGMYINDTNGSGMNRALELELEDDVSFVSLGQPPLMANMFRALGGTHQGPGYVVLDGVEIPISKLRVVDPCVQHATCVPAADLRSARNRGRRHRGHRNKRRHKRSR